MVWIGRQSCHNQWWVSNRKCLEQTQEREVTKLCSGLVHNIVALLQLGPASTNSTNQIWKILIDVLIGQELGELPPICAKVK